MTKLLDLAEAQLLRFAMGKNNPYGILSLIESMGLTKKEWIKLKSKPLDLDKHDIEAIDNYFNIQS